MSDQIEEEFPVDRDVIMPCELKPFGTVRNDGSLRSSSDIIHIGLIIAVYHSESRS